MTRGKRKQPEGDAMRANKENAIAQELDNVMRRSARNRGQQKTPLQRLEEISSVVSGTGRVGQFTSANDTPPSILQGSEVNPMAPDSKKRRKSAVKGRNESTSTPSNVLQPTVLGAPTTIDIQQFAALTAGHTPVSGDDNFNYTLRFPSPGLNQPPGRVRSPLPDIVSQPPQPRSDVYSIPSQGAEGATTLEGNDAAFSYNFGLEYQPRLSQPMGTMSTNANSVGGAVYNANDVSSAPGVVYNWLQDRQELGAPSMDNSSFSDGANFYQLPATASQGEVNWIDGNGANSSHSGSDSEYDFTESSGDEMAQGSTTSLGNNFWHCGTETLNVTTDSSLRGALGSSAGASSSSNDSRPIPGSSSATSNTSAAYATSDGMPRVTQQRFPPIAVPQEGHAVLDAHYERNRRPRPPATERLRASHASGSTNRRPDLRPAATASAANHVRRLRVPDVAMRRVASARPVAGGQRGVGNTSQGIASSSRVATNVAKSHETPTNNIDSEQSDVGESEVDEPPAKTRAPRFSKTPRASKPVEPDKSEYYPVNWQAVLKIAKMLLRRWIALQVPFPDRRQHFGKMLEFIGRALEIFQSGGGYVEDGYYNEHRRDMQKLLWDEIANFRGTIKQYARLAITGYNFIPEGIEDSEIYRATIDTNVRNLKEDAFFLQNGVDENGSVNNFCHPIFRQVTLASFYSSASKLATHFPEDFGDFVPRQAQALVATAMICVLDEWLGGAHKTIKFSGEKYARKLADILDLMANLEADPVQARKLQMTRRVWALMGRDPEDEPANNGFAVAL